MTALVTQRPLHTQHCAGTTGVFQRLEVHGAWRYLKMFLRTIKGAAPASARSWAAARPTLGRARERLPGLTVVASRNRGNLADIDLALAVGLAKNPGDRFQDAESLTTAIAQALEGELDDAVRQRAEALLDKRPWR